MEQRSKARLVSAVVVGVVFATGVLIGYTADKQLGGETPEVVAEAAVATPAEEASSGERRRAPIYTQVDPTPEQQGRIDWIVGMHRERTNALDKETRAAYRAGFRNIVLETREAIKGVLDEQQAAEYQRLLDEWDARQAAEREREREERERPK